MPHIIFVSLPDLDASIALIGFEHKPNFGDDSATLLTRNDVDESSIN